MTEKEALAFYKIGIHINPFQKTEKEEVVSNFMKLTLEKGIEYLQDYIVMYHEDIREVLEDEELLRQYINILKRVKSKKGER